MKPVSILILMEVGPEVFWIYLVTGSIINGVSILILMEVGPEARGRPLSVSLILRAGVDRGFMFQSLF